MKPPIRRPAHTSTQGFTLIEVLASIGILSTVMALVWMSFYNVMRSSRKAELLLDQINQTEFVVDQVIDALRAAAFFPETPEQFGFWHEDDDGRFPADMVSWVTSSSAFMPPRSDLAHGLHRIVLTIEEDRDGELGLAVAAWPYMQDPEDDDFEEVEPWIVSRRIKGMDCQVWDETAEEWIDEWEHRNSLPQFVKFTFTVQPAGKDAKTYERAVLIAPPLGTLARSRGRFAPQPTDPGGTAEPGRSGEATLIQNPGVLPTPGGPGRPPEGAGRTQGSGGRR